MPETTFGPFTFDPTTRELFRDGRPVPLPPKASLVLLALVSARGRLVSRKALYEAAWQGTVVEYDQGLNTCIRQIRRALGDDARAPRYIETIPRRGYRFCYPLTAPRERRSTARPFRRIAAALLLLVGVLGALYVQPWAEEPLNDDIALGAFLVDGFAVSMGGLDQRLEGSVRQGLAARGFNPDQGTPSFILTGTLSPSTDGALFQATLIRLSDGVRIWHGSYNPFCPDAQGDPVQAIGHLVAQAAVYQAARVVL